MIKFSTKSLFVFGLLARVAIMPMSGSPVAHQLFIPFLDSAIHNIKVNPWALHEPKFFPYGSVLYGLLALPRLLCFSVYSRAEFVPWMSVALLKAPLLFCDIGLLLFLKKIVPQRFRQIVIFYWLNPVLFFISYVHVQLDVAATFFLVAALSFAVQDKVRWSGVFMGLATLCKAHVLVVAPLFLAFFWRRHFRQTALKNIANWCFIWLALTGAGFLPHWQAASFAYVTMFSPQAFQVFDARFDLDQTQVVYVGVGALTILLARLCSAKKITELGLIFGSGLVFGCLLLITNSGPGWYFWPMPFIALLFANYTQTPVTLYAAFCGLYLCCFLEAPIFPINMLSSATFTLLQTTLAVILYLMWRVVVRWEAPLGMRGRPIMFGIAGDSGTGKNVLSETLADLFQPGSPTLLEGDDYHKWERGDPKWRDYTHLDPKANHLDELAIHTVDLAQGRLVWQPQYDHSCGQFTEPREIRTSRVVIVQGLHALYLRDMRAQFNVKIYLAPQPKIRRAWKLYRDVVRRGYSREKVLANMTAREKDADLHIAPQRAAADWVIETHSIEPHPVDEDILKGVRVKAYTKHVLWNDVPVSHLCALLKSKAGLHADLRVLPGDMDRVTFTVEGRISQEDIAAIARLLYPDLRALVDSSRSPVWRSDAHGITQLVALAFLQRQDQNVAAH